MCRLSETGRVWCTIKNNDNIEDIDRVGVFLLNLTDVVLIMGSFVNLKVTERAPEVAIDIPGNCMI